MDLETERYAASVASMEVALARNRVGSSLLTVLQRYRSFPKMNSKTSVQRVHKTLCCILKGLETTQFAASIPAPKPPGLGLFPRLIMHANFAGESWFVSTNKHTYLAIEVIASIHGGPETVLNEGSLLRTDITQVLRQIDDMGATAVVVVDVPFGVPVQNRFFKIVSLRYVESKASFVDSELVFSSLCASPPARSSASILKQLEGQEVDHISFLRSNRLQDVDNPTGGVVKATIMCSTTGQGGVVACGRCAVSMGVIAELKSDIAKTNQLVQERESHFQLELQRQERDVRESATTMLHDDLGDVYTRFENERLQHMRTQTHLNVIESELKVLEKAGPPAELTDELAKLRGRVLELEEEKQRKKTNISAAQKRATDLERQLKKAVNEKAEAFDGLRVLQTSTDERIETIKSDAAQARRTASEQLAQLVDKVKDMAIENSETIRAHNALDALLRGKTNALEKEQRLLISAKKRYLATRTEMNEIEIRCAAFERATKNSILRGGVRMRRAKTKIAELESQVEDAERAAAAVTSSPVSEEKTETTVMGPEAASALLNVVSNALSLGRRLEHFVELARAVPTGKESAYPSQTITVVSASPSPTSSLS